MSWWIIALIEAASLRAQYAQGRTIPEREQWLASKERADWFSGTIPAPSTWEDLRRENQRVGANELARRIMKPEVAISTN